MIEYLHIAVLQPVYLKKQPLVCSQMISLGHFNGLMTTEHFEFALLSLPWQKGVAGNSIYVKVQACTWFETSGPGAEAPC